MSSVAQQVADLRSKGVELWELDSVLRYNAPPGGLAPELAAEISQSERAIIGFLRDEQAAQYRELGPHLRAENKPLPASSTEASWWGTMEAGYDKSSATDMVICLELGGPLELRALERSLDELIVRHEIFRTRFFVSEHGLCRTIDVSSRFALVKGDVSGVPHVSRQADLVQRIEAEVLRPFDLVNDHLIRALLIKSDDERHVLAIVIHHLICDMASMEILIGDLFATYKFLASGSEPPPPSNDIQYADYALWEGRRLQLQKWKLEEYWKQRLSSRKDWFLPQDLQNDQSAPVIAQSYFAEIPEELVDALTSYAERKRMTLYMVLLSALNAALHTWSGGTDISIWSITSARMHPRLRKVIGHFVYHTIIRTDLSSDPTLAEISERLRSGYLRDLSFLPLDAKQIGARPLPVMVNYLPPMPTEMEIGPLTVRYHPLQLTPVPSPILPLSVYIQAKAKGMSLYLRYNGSLFYEATMARLMDVMLKVLRAMIRDEKTPLARIEW